jgi:hypothetical protein
MELLMPAKKYYDAHREKCITDTQQWKKDNVERSRANGALYMRRKRGTEEGHELALATNRKWARANPEKVKRNYAEWRAKNPDYNKQYMKKRYAANPAIFILQGAKQRSKRNGLKCTITLADLTIPIRCPVLGIPIYKGSGSFHRNSPSVDRFDPKLGYVPGNVQIVSWRANELKKDGTLEEFRKIVAFMEKQLG